VRRGKRELELRGVEFAALWQQLALARLKPNDDWALRRSTSPIMDFESDTAPTMIMWFEGGEGELLPPFNVQV
jgi:hypothetical protein